MPPGTKPEYRFDIRSDAAGATLGKRRIPVSDAKVEIVAATRLVEVKRIEGKSFSGTLTAEGQVTPGKGRDLAYEGNVWLRDVDVKALADHVAVVERKKQSHLSGRGSANARVWGTGADAGRMAIENFRASGRFEILDGDFWSVPVVDEIAGKAKAPPDALTVGRAAGVFEVHDQVVELRQAALSAPLLGVQGDGRVAFDGRLDLHVVAAPLADWKDGMKRLRIPVVSDVAGEVLGTLQKMINTAEKTLLYEFRVSGTTREPKVEAVPTPVLTDGVAKLFGAMARGEKWDVEGGAPRNSKPGH